jgi:hypothetical protein
MYLYIKSCLDTFKFKHIFNLFGTEWVVKIVKEYFWNVEVVPFSFLTCLTTLTCFKQPKGDAHTQKNGKLFPNYMKKHCCLVFVISNPFLYSSTWCCIWLERVKEHHAVMGSNPTYFSWCMHLFFFTLNNHYENPDSPTATSPSPDLRLA